MKLFPIYLIFLSSLFFSKSIQFDAPDRLEPWYLGYNVKYFNGELPTDIQITHDLVNDCCMAVTNYVGKTGLSSIQFNKKYEPSLKQARMTLLHEQCHIFLATHNEFELDDHGPKWQICMHDLSRKGAFEDLW